MEGLKELEGVVRASIQEEGGREAEEDHERGRGRSSEPAGKRRGSPAGHDHVGQN